MSADKELLMEKYREVPAIVRSFCSCCGVWIQASHFYDMAETGMSGLWYHCQNCGSTGFRADKKYQKSQEERRRVNR